MKASIKEAWVAALRSGKYKQGRFRLESRDGENFCCLGVLCKVTGKSTKTKRGKDPAYKKKFASLGISHFVEYLVRLNDTNRLTFPQIATCIEEEIYAEP